MLGKSSTNPEGHFENMDFLRLNEKILEKAGAEKVLRLDEIFNTKSANMDTI